MPVSRMGAGKQLRSVVRLGKPTNFLMLALNVGPGVLEWLPYRPALIESLCLCCINIMYFNVVMTVFVRVVIQCTYCVCVCVWDATRMEDLLTSNTSYADHSCRARWGMKYFFPLEHWDHGFKSH
jgi:hypothetical protein